MTQSAHRAGTPAFCLALLAFAASLPAAADIYRWVDAQGVVNYGEHPPAASKARLVAPERTPLTVYPAPDRNAKTASGTNREAALDARVEELERQLARQSQQLESGASLAEQREAERLERCRRERRVDCGDEVLEVAYPTTVFVQPRPPRWKPHRPAPRPPGLRPPRPPEPTHRMLPMPQGR